MHNIIEIKDLYFKYDDEYVINNLSLDIKKGTWTSIVGHNGSGKSTLTKLLVGLLFSSEGSIKICDSLVEESTMNNLRKKIGIVFQNPDNQFVGTTVKDDHAFGLENHCVDSKDMENIIKDTLSKVDMLDYINHEPHNLSGGQKQRVTIASILALKPEILILDEATSMLDPEGRKEILDLIKKLQNDNLTVITITHDLEETLYSDSIAILKNGSLVKHDLKDKILNDTELLENNDLELLVSQQVLKLVRNSEILKDNKELLEELCKLNLKI